jgi:hypothetical protein
MKNFVIAVVVGTLLTLANQFDVIVRSPVRTDLLVKICFNFLIPFVVSSVSAYAKPMWSTDRISTKRFGMS